MPCQKDGQNGLNGKAADEPVEDREWQLSGQGERDAERNRHDKQQKNRERQAGESGGKTVREDLQRRVGKGRLQRKYIEQNKTQDKEAEDVNAKHRQILQMIGDPGGKKYHAGETGQQDQPLDRGTFEVFLPYGKIIADDIRFPSLQSFFHGSV